MVDPVKLMLAAVEELTENKGDKGFNHGKLLAKDMLGWLQMKNKQKGYSLDVILLAIYLLLTALVQSVSIVNNAKKN